MLTFDLDIERITTAQQGYLNQGTRRGTWIANSLRAMRVYFEHAAKRFSQRQTESKARRIPYLENGHRQKLQDQVMGGGPFDWPMRAAAILHGIKLDPFLSLPATACCPGGPTLVSLDGESYIAELADGPP